MNAELEFGTGMDGIGWAHPLVRDWFVARFGSPTEPQVPGGRHILPSGDNSDFRAYRLWQNAGGFPSVH